MAWEDKTGNYILAESTLFTVKYHKNVWFFACLFFFKNNSIINPDIFVSRERLQGVNKYKFLGLHIDSHLSFRPYKVCNTIKFMLSKFRLIRDSMLTVKVYIFSQ